MTTQTNIDRTQALHAAFSANRYEDVLALAADDIEVVAHAIGQTFHGKEQFRQFFMAFKTAMPDLRIAHTNTIASEEQVAVEFVGTGTHAGPLMTPAGVVPPSGRLVTLSVIEVHHWRDGKLSRMVNYQDAMALLVQVGAMAAPAGL